MKSESAEPQGLIPASEIVHSGTPYFSPELGFVPELVGRHGRHARVLGMGFLVLGFFAIFLPNIFTIAFELLLGILLVLGGALQVISSLGFSGKREWDWGFPLWGGSLAILLGALLLLYPSAGAAALTVFLAALFLMSGVLRISHGLQWRGVPGIGWGVFSGFLSIFIAFLIFAAWPSASNWFIGLLLGIDFLMMGIILNIFANACQRESLRQGDGINLTARF